MTYCHRRNCKIIRNDLCECRETAIVGHNLLFVTSSLLQSKSSLLIPRGDEVYSQKHYRLVSRVYLERGSMRLYTTGWIDA